VNKGVIIGIIIVVAIAIGFGVLVSSDNTAQSNGTDESLAETEEIQTPKSYSVTLDESLSVETA